MVPPNDAQCQDWAPDSEWMHGRTARAARGPLGPRAQARAWMSIGRPGERGRVHNRFPTPHIPLWHSGMRESPNQASCSTVALDGVTPSGAAAVSVGCLLTHCTSGSQPDLPRLRCKTRITEHGGQAMLLLANVEERQARQSNPEHHQSGRQELGGTPSNLLGHGSKVSRKS